MSESSALSEGEDWADTLLGPQVPQSGREAAFNRLLPGRRPDTIVLRGIPVNWLAEKGKAEEGMPAPVRYYIYLWVDVWLKWELLVFTTW